MGCASSAPTTNPQGQPYPKQQQQQQQQAAVINQQMIMGSGSSKQSSEPYPLRNYNQPMVQSNQYQPPGQGYNNPGQTWQQREANSHQNWQQQQQQQLYQQQQQQQQQQYQQQQQQWQKQQQQQLQQNAGHHPPPQQQHQQPPPQQQQRMAPPPQEKEEKTDIKVKKVKLDKHVIERYLELEKQTREFESKNVLKNYNMKQGQLKEFDDNVKEYEEQYKRCVKQTAKEKADVDNMGNPSVQAFFSQQSDFDAKLMEEQEEYLEALNKQEIAKKELDSIKKLRDQIKGECNSLKKEAEKIQKIYTEQDELLAGIFNGKYGSDSEYKLESELDMLLDRKQRISVAKYKWQNGRLLLQHSVNQMAFAVKKWEEVIKVPPNNMQMRYTLATECRNNLVAANQNITSAQKYLHTIEFPYCKPPEMLTLTKATSNIYTDMQSNERHGHAMQCYTTTHKRAAALLQWFDHVIKTTIDKDLNEANKAVDMKTKELRKERLRLIKEKVHEAKGNDENLDIEGEMDLEDGPEPELQNLVTDADTVSTAGDQGGESAPPQGPTPLPLNQLAPAPNTEDLFGNIDNLKKQHEEDMEEFSKAQDVNKARMEQGLQEKLKARRSRRARQDNEE